MTDVIVQGDCIVRMGGMGRESVDCCVIDPPYNLGVSYDSYEDKRPQEEFLRWAKLWLWEASRLVVVVDPPWLCVWPPP